MSDDITNEQWEAAQRISAALLSDVLHSMGYSARTMRPDIQPYAAGVRTVGFARTVSSRPVEKINGPHDVYAQLFESIDGLNHGDVLVTDQVDCCFWGEMMSSVAVSKKANGVVVDGYYRDHDKIVDLRFPVFSRGRSISDSLYHRQATAINAPVICGGVYVRAGDLVVGDSDGVVVVPREVLGETIGKALEKRDKEAHAMSLLKSDVSAAETYRVTGTL